MSATGRFYHVCFAMHAVSSDFFLISFLIKLPLVGEMMVSVTLFQRGVLRACFSEAQRSFWPDSGNTDQVLLARGY